MTRGPRSTSSVHHVIRCRDDVPTDGSFAWLSYLGHWGEKAPSFDNGPTGPITKTQWDEPVQWVDDEGRTRRWRSRSPVPGRPVRSAT